MNKELLEKLTVSALNGIISNEETMKEITKIVNENPDKNVDFYSVISNMSIKYAQTTLDLLEKVVKITD